MTEGGSISPFNWPESSAVSTTIPPIVAEETAALSDIRTRLLEHPLSARTTSEVDIAREIQRLQSQLGGAKEEDKAAMFQQIDHLASLLDQVRSQSARPEVDPDSPYFAHMRLSEGRRERDIFLGRATRLSHGIRIVDWRNAPISRLFYRYEQDEEYAEEVNGTIREGSVSIRRTVHIEGGELRRVDGPDRTWVRTSDSWRALDPEAQALAGGQGAADRCDARRESPGSYSRSGF